MRDRLQESFVHSYDDRTYVETAMVNHDGTVVAVAMDDTGRLFYSVLDLESSRNDLAADERELDVKHWLQSPAAVPFPAEIEQVGYGLLNPVELPVVAAGSKAEATDPDTVKATARDPFLSTSARLTARGAPFQLISDNKYLYLFRQAIGRSDPDAVFKTIRGGSSAAADTTTPSDYLQRNEQRIPIVDETLLVDRYILAGNALQLPREVRFRRSRNRTRPASAKDSLGATDMQGRPFFEPTKELAFVGNLVNGCFSAVLVPTEIPDIERWQIFAYNNATQAIDCYSIERSADGLFNPQGSQLWTSPDDTYKASVLERDPGTCPFTGRSLVPVAPPEQAPGALALRLDGTGDGIELADESELQITGDQTIEVWIKPKANRTTRQNLFHKSYGGEGTIVLETNGTLGYAFGTAGTDGKPFYGTASAPTVIEERWYHVAVVRDMTIQRVTIFVDGDVVGTSLFNVASDGAGRWNPGLPSGEVMAAASSTRPVKIGVGYLSAFEGEIDEVRLWNVARTAAEITQTASIRLHGAEPGLVSYLRLDRPFADAPIDLAARGRRPTRIGNPQQVTSDAPDRFAGAVEKTSFAIDGRRAGAGMAARLYYEQESVSTGSVPKSVKHNARVLVAATTDGLSIAPPIEDGLLVHLDGESYDGGNQWDDLSGNGHHAFAPYGSAMPALTTVDHNNRRFKALRGSSGLLGLRVLELENAITIMVVDRQFGPNGVSFNAGGGWVTDAESDPNRPRSRANPRFRFGNHEGNSKFRFTQADHETAIPVTGDGNVAPPVISSAGRFVINTGTISTDEARWYLNGAEQGAMTMAAGYEVRHGSLSILGSSASIEMACLLIWDRVLGEDERKRVEAWLGERYGIAVGHSVARRDIEAKQVMAIDVGVGRDGRLASIPETVSGPALRLPNPGGPGSDAVTDEIDAQERTIPALRQEIAGLEAQRTSLDHQLALDPTSRSLQNQRHEVDRSYHAKRGQLQTEETKLWKLRLREVGAVAPATVPTGHTDERGLTVAAGLLPFARTEGAPKLFDSAAGRIGLYLASSEGQPSVTHYQTVTSKGWWELETRTDTTGSGVPVGAVVLQARSADEASNQATVSVADSPRPDLCTVTIANPATNLTETWQDVSRNPVELAATLRGDAGPPITVGATKMAVTAGTVSSIELQSPLTRTLRSGSALVLGNPTGGRPSTLTLAATARTGEVTLTVSGTVADHAGGASVAVLPYDYAALASTSRSGDRLHGGSLLLTPSVPARTDGVVVNTSGAITTRDPVSGPSFVPEAPGMTLSFDGGAHHLVAADPSKLAHTDNLTIEAWVEPRTFTGDAIVVHDNSGDSQYSLGLRSASTSAASFDGSNWVVLSNHADLQITGDLTIEFWIKPTAERTKRMSVLHKSFADEYSIVLEPDGLLSSYFGPPGTRIAYHDFKSTPLVEGVWQHVALVRDMSAKRTTFYIDGQISATSSFAATSDGTGNWRDYDQVRMQPSWGDRAGTSTGGVSIGGGYANGLNAPLDEVRIWNVARTRLDIVADQRRRLDGDHPGLVAYHYDLSTSVDDRSGNGHNGTRTGNRLHEVAGPLPAYKVFAAVDNAAIVATYPLTGNSWRHLAAVHRQDYALKFDGNDVVDAGTDPGLDITGDLTIEAVVKLDSVGRKHGIVSKGFVDDGGLGTCPYSLAVDEAGRLIFTFEDEGGANHTYRSTGTVAAGKVTRIAVSRKQGQEKRQATKDEPFTYTDSTGAAHTRTTQVIDSIDFKDYSDITFSIDGQSAGTSRHDAKPPGGNREQLFIGRAHLAGNTQAHLAGSLAELRIWSVGLAATEVGTAAITGTEAGLSAWWRFDDGAGPIATDSRGSSHGRIVGAAWEKTPDTNRNGFQLYVDGAPVTAEPLTTRPSVGDANSFTVGCRMASGSAEALYSGRLEELRIWGTVRRREAILDNLFARLQGQPSELLAHYSFDDIDPSTGQVPDRSFGSNHLTPPSDAARPSHTRSTAPISSEAAQIRPALAGVTTDFTDTATSAPAVAEYADLQTLEDGSLAGVYKRAYTYTTSGTWKLITGYRVGDLVTEWVGQAQFDPQVVGYIEGAPPVPSENLTEGYRRSTQTFNRTSEVSIVESESVNYSISSSSEGGFKSGFGIESKMGAKFEPRVIAAPMGIGMSIKLPSFEGSADNELALEANGAWGGGRSIGAGENLTRRMTASIGGNWEGGDNPSTWVNPDLTRRFVPGNMGFAFVESETVDIYALRLAETGTLVAFRMLPNPDIPRDTNIIPFPINPRYTKQGTLDGRIGISAEGGPVLDPDYAGASGYGEYSYLKPREAYRLKQRIDREEQRVREYYNSFDTTPAGARVMGDSAMAGAGLAALGFATAARFGGSVAAGPVVATMNLAGGMGATIGSMIDLAAAGDTDLPSKFARRNLVNTYVWTADGGFYEESAQISQVRSESKTGSYSIAGASTGTVGAKVEAVVTRSLSLNGSLGGSYNLTKSRSEHASSSFKIGMSLLVGDNLQRYEYVDPADATRGYRPVFDGENNPVSHPGKVDAYRFMTFYLEPQIANFEDLFGKVVDPIWLAQSNHPNATALRAANQSSKKPRCWRLFHRVTFVSRILPTVPPMSAPPLEQKMRKLDLSSNWELVKALEPYVERNTVDWATYKDSVERAVRTHLPELATDTELSQIVGFMADYHGIVR